MAKPLHIALDRAAGTPLAEQIRAAISAAIESGLLAPGARLPSWIDLATQLGVARGTVRQAYERLADAQLVEASRTSGTRVAVRPAVPPGELEQPCASPFMAMYEELTAGPAMFQMGVPAQETLPAKLFTNVRSFALRAQSNASVVYPDPRGEMDLRKEIAAYLAIARGIQCLPAQIIVTSGFSGGLGLTLRVLGLDGQKVWMENPGFPFTRHGLELANLRIAAVPVDAEGIHIDAGLQRAPDAALAVVTPGQQAPLGPTLSLARRLQLLDWSARQGAWIIEDDYLSELQLSARAAPALASLDRRQRVIHLGSFSKTISPALRLGFIVAPLPLVARFAEAAACLAPAPWPAVQLAAAQFMRDGHYMRHLRRMKHLYGAQRDALLACLAERNFKVSTAGLAVLLRLPDGAPDLAILRELQAFGLAPAPLSPWYAPPDAAKSGFLLGIATAPEKHLVRSCDRLEAVIRRFV